MEDIRKRWTLSLLGMAAVLVITDSDAHFLVIIHGGWPLFECF